jgi:hypothetical protein
MVHRLSQDEFYEVESFSSRSDFLRKTGFKPVIRRQQTQRARRLGS